MRIRSDVPSWLVASVAVLSLGGCSNQGAPNALAPTGQSAQNLMADPNATRTVTIPFDAGNFATHAPNSFFPLVPNTRWVYTQETPEGVETDTVLVTTDTKLIVGVTTTVVRDRVFLNGVLAEDTFDWYASDEDGNVWYFGEATQEFPSGSTLGSWEAGKDNAQPGIIMLAHPMVGDVYQQENSPGVVADMARVKDLDATAVTPYGTLTGCLKTQEWTPLESGSRAFKYYAPGIGNVMEDENKAGGRVVLTGFTTP